MSKESRKRGRISAAAGIIPPVEGLNHKRIAWDISCMLYLTECAAVGSLRDGVEELHEDFGFEEVPATLSVRKAESKDPDFEKKIQESNKNSQRGFVRFWCKGCKKTINYREPSGETASYLNCTCGCKCECHSTTRWNKSDCICKPCFICQVGAPGMPLNGPIASCGRQRLCHFGMRCRKKDTSCGFLHEE